MKGSFMYRVVLLALVALVLAGPAAAFDGESRAYAASTPKVSGDEVLRAGHELFGTTTSGLAGALQNVLSRFGPPDGYIVGEEGAGAFFGGLRYGEGALQLAGQAPTPVFWQGPSVGWDFGGAGSRVMMLVYNVRAPGTVMQRFTGVDGSAYMIGGVSMTVMAAQNSYVVPVRTGVGARLGVSLGYLKFTPRPTWNPF